MKDVLKIAVLGLGGRGTMLVRDELVNMKDAEVAVVCDLYEDRMQHVADIVADKTGKRPAMMADYREVLKTDVDAVIIATAWEPHVDIACAAMEAGKYVGLEVGGAYSVTDCWRLVHTYERTGTKLMFLENCCYGKRELMALHMVRQGLFGDVVHCSGGYCHDLREEVANGEENRHYRLRNYLHRNCENYPTHELVPIGKILNINDGNRFVSLTSTASCAKGLHTYCVENKGADHALSRAQFAQGDIVTTVIKCANGETVTITLDTTLPRSYSRGFTIRGTKAAYFEDTDSFFFDNEHHAYEFNGRGLWGNAAQYEEQHLHPIWQNYDGSGSHDGMDHLMLRAFIEVASQDIEPPIDVYDAATYMSITALSEQSIAEGSAPQAIPDFTGGKFCNRAPYPKTKYALR